MPVVPNENMQPAAGKVSRTISKWAATNGAKGGATTAARGKGHRWTPEQARVASERRWREVRQARATRLMREAVVEAVRKL